MGGDFKAVAVTEGMMTSLMNDIRAMRVQLGRVDAAGAADLLEKQAAKLESAAQAGCRANSMSEDAARSARRAAQVMTEMAADIRKSDAATGIEDRAFKSCRGLADASGMVIVGGILFEYPHA